MKKKLLSLMLVVVILMTSVSVGFSSMTAYAGTVGKAAETINAFSLIGNLDASGKPSAFTGSSFSSNITIKSKSANHKIRIQKVEAKIINYTYDSSGNVSAVETTDLVSVGYTPGEVCTTAGTKLSVSGNIPSGVNGLIRYVCTYDILDNNSNVLYSGLTGYGYDALSADGPFTGGTGGDAGAAPSGGNYDYNWFNQPQKVYVQQGAFTLGYKTTVPDGTSGKTVTPSIAYGTKPSTLSFTPIEFLTRDKSSDDAEKEGTWWTLSGIPASGYYRFGISIAHPTGASATATIPVEMLYLSDSDRASVWSVADQYINYNLEKSYYTTETWNNYLAALEKAQIAARAVHNNSGAFRLACQNFNTASSQLSTAMNNLQAAKADYTALNSAISTFNSKNSETNSVTTYKLGTGSNGTDEYVEGGASVKIYSADKLAEIQSYISANIPLNSDGTAQQTVYRYEQEKVDAHTNYINEKLAALTEGTADFTYLDSLVEHYETNLVASHYTESSWNYLLNRITSAKNLNRGILAANQSQVDAWLRNVISAKNALAYAQADTGELTKAIEEANAIVNEYNSGLLASNKEGFAETWADFQDKMDAATAALDYNKDRQDDVDTAAAELLAACEGISRYRYLDTTALLNAIGLKLPEGHTQDNYEEDSYKVWQRLKAEGETFMQKAQPGYGYADAKTYEDKAEMERLTEMIIDAYNSLQKKKADFTKLNDALSQVPSDEELSLYDDTFVDNTIRSLLATVDYSKTFDQQEEVDQLAADILVSLEGLKDDSKLKPADYSKIDKAIEDFNNLDKSVYEKPSLDKVDAAINAVVRGKNIRQQSEVDAMLANINSAIASLEYVPADYTKVDEAISRAEKELEYPPEMYGNYNRVEEAIAAVDRTKRHNEQAEVDAMAKAINDAIDALYLAEADYSGVNAAIAEAKKLEPLTDFTDETVEALDLAIAKVIPGLTKDRQADVDAMASEINIALENMELLPINYASANAAIKYAEQFKPEEYENYQAVTDAIKAIDWNLNCRQQDVLKAQVGAIYAACNNLNMLPADYTDLNKVIEDAKYACENGLYPYTDESIALVYAEIYAVNPNHTIQEQEDVNAYIPKIQEAVKNLKYIRADYEAVDAAIKDFESRDPKIYTGLDEIRLYISKIDMEITVDRQAEVDAIADEINAMLDALEYADGNYTAVIAAQSAYEALNRDHYEAEDFAIVEALYNAIVPGLKANEQDRIDKMAKDLNDAIDVLRTKIKPADLTGLNNAVNAANEKLDTMAESGYEIEENSRLALRLLLNRAGGYEGSNMDAQPDIDALTAQIIEATANLEYVFSIVDIEESGLTIEGNIVYGFEEGAMASDAAEQIKFVGAAEMKVYESRNGFGTGTIIQFVSTKDGSILATYTVLFFGDANGDCVIDSFDVAYLIELVNTFAEVDTTLLRALDIDGSGSLDANDVTIMTSVANEGYYVSQDGSYQIY